MKLFGTALSFILCACLMCFSVSAAGYTDADGRFSLEIPDEYVVIDSSTVSSNSEFISKLGSSVENFKKSMEEGNIVLYAATEDNQRQLQVKVFDSDTAQKIGELSKLSEDNFATAADEIEKLVIADGELLNSERIDKNGTCFLRYTVRAATALESESEEIGYCFDEYLTVADGRFCALIYYNSSSEFDETDAHNSKAVFDTFEVVNADVQQGSTAFEWVLKILIPLLIAAAVLLGAWIIYTFVRDIKHRREQPEVIPDHIKMRRK